MKSTFAANDADSIRTVLIDGFTFDSATSRQGEIARKLANLGLVHLITCQYKRCANPNDDDYGLADPECRTLFFLDSEATDDVVYCNYCNREVELDGKQVFEKYTVRLDTSGILRYIGMRFKQAGFNVENLAHGWTNFNVEGKSCILCFPSHCAEAKYLSYHYVYSNPILYVYLPYVCPTPEALPSLKYIVLEDLICQNESWLRDKIEEALTVDVTLPSAEGLELAFDNFVAQISASEFEQFASFVFNKTAHSRNGIRQYERLLKRDQNNIHGQYAAPAGGAGHSDVYVFKKRSYLSGLFDGKWQHIEAKRYASQKSILDDQRFSGFYSNCQEQPGAIFLANNRVTGDVWSKVKDFYDRDEYAKYAIIPKDLLLELIAALGGEAILREFLAKRDHGTSRNHLRQSFEPR